MITLLTGNDIVPRLVVSSRALVPTPPQFTFDASAESTGMCSTMFPPRTFDADCETTTGAVRTPDDDATTFAGISVSPPPLEHEMATMFGLPPVTDVLFRLVTIPESVGGRVCSAPVAVDSVWICRSCCGPDPDTRPIVANRGCPAIDTTLFVSCCCCGVAGEDDTLGGGTGLARRCDSC